MKTNASRPRRRCRISTPGCSLALVVLMACCGPRGGLLAAPDDREATFKAFANPPVEYSTGMLWVWNDLLDERQIRETLRDLASQGVKQPYVHPRPGLMTPYLSPEWFRLWRIAVDESKQLGLKL